MTDMLAIELRWGTSDKRLDFTQRSKTRSRTVWTTPEGIEGEFWRLCEARAILVKGWTAVYSGTHHIGEGATAQAAVDDLLDEMSSAKRMLVAALEGT